MVPSRPLSEPHEEARVGCRDGPDAHAGGQLVQEPATAGPRGGRQEPVGGARQRLRVLVHLRRGLGRLRDQRRRGVAACTD